MGAALLETREGGEDTKNWNADVLQTFAHLGRTKVCESLKLVEEDEWG